MQPSDHIAATVQICPRCGAEFSGGPGLKNLCPRCLMQSVLADSAPADEGGPTAELRASQPAHRPEAEPKKATGFQFRSGDRVLDGYTIVAPVGRGGFGEVYHARSDAGKDVALKIVQRFLEVELRGVGHCLNLKHANLVTIFDARPDSAGQHWIVMEFVAGRSLAQAIDGARNGLAVEEILHWLEGITAAVEHLHESGIVHRDLKPSNIFDDRSTVKVGDYGLAKFITASRRSGQTQSIGTLHYMAPEIGCGRYGREVDVYAVGIMLYEMLTGDVPFDGETPAEILMKHLTAAPDLNKLPPAFRGIVGRMLAKRPEERYGSLSAVMADLKARLADAASGQFEPVEDLPYYSSPGVSTWLEAPLATFQQQFALHAPPGPSTVSASPRYSGSQSGPSVIRILFLLVFSTLFLGFALYLFMGGAVGLLWMFFGLIGLVAVLVFASRMGRSFAAPVHEEPPASDPVRRVRRYEPRSESEFPEPPVAPSPARSDDPAPQGTWLGVVGAILIALFWGFGTGLLVAGTMLLIWPREDEIAAVCSIGAGFFVASVVAIRCLFSVGASAFLRLIAAIFCGASVGLAAFGIGLAAHARDEEAALQGVGAGLFAAGLIALGFYGRRSSWRLWRAFAGLLAGAGTGLLCGGLLLSSGVRPDEFVAIASCGIGFMTAGWIWFGLFVHARRYTSFRVLTALLNGAGVGLLVAAVTLFGANEEAAAFLGIGAGFMACGIAGFRLLVGAQRAPELR